MEALDDPGNAAAYSPEGFARLTGLGAELRGLRAHAARPLAELVTEVERTLGLDIEVASRPGTDPAVARADLDAFTDAAATFAGDAQEPTLGAFLAYLAAAESEEFGLEAGQVGDTDSVKLATVHAAKGLQWPVVFVPGLAGGVQAHLFPARPRYSTRWTDNARLLPFGLRGDAADLPGLAGLSAAELTGFGQACSARDLAEERRLAYVAATRAAYFLGCSGFWWSEGATRLGPSRFLTEARAACEDGAGEVDIWHPEPAPDAVNPALAEPASATWPAAVAAGARYDAVREAGALVDAAIAAGDVSAASASSAGKHGAGRSVRRDDGGLVARHGPAASRARGTADRARGPGRPAAPAAGLRARDDGQGSGRARPAGPPAHAAQAGAAGDQGHGVPRVAGRAIRPGPADRRRRAAGGRRRRGRAAAATPNWPS